MSGESVLSMIRMQVMWNRLISVVEEQAQTLVRTAFSTSVREAGDLAAAVFDHKGRMLAQAVTGTPGHVNAMAEGIIQFIAKFPVEEMEPGDVLITNDPWVTSGHLHDITVVTPTFHKGRPIALFANTCQKEMDSFAMLPEEENTSGVNEPFSYSLMRWPYSLFFSFSCSRWTSEVVMTE